MTIEKITLNKISLEIMDDIVIFTTQKEVKDKDEAFDIFKNDVAVIKIYDTFIEIYKYLEDATLSKFVSLYILETNKDLIEDAFKKYGRSIENTNLINEILEPYRFYTE